MAARATFTYTVTTDESAEIGEWAEHGWYLPGGWEYPLETWEGDRDDGLIDRARAGEFDQPVGEAIMAARELGCSHVELCWDGLSVQTVDPPLDRANIEQGEERAYTLHVSGISAGTARRIARLFGWTPER